MTQLSDIIISGINGLLRFGLMLVCWFVLFQSLELSTLLVAFLGLFFGGFLFGVFEASWDDETADSLFRPMMYLGLLLGGSLAIVLSPVAGTALIILFGLIASDGYQGQTRYANGEQPFQKYKWFPADALKSPLIPYYYYKHQKGELEPKE